MEFPAFNGLFFDHPESRRRKVIRLNPEIILSAIFSWGKNLPATIHVPHIDGIPPDAKIVGVVYGDLARSFAIMLEHPTFDEVPDGQETAGIPILWESVAFDKYVRKEDAVKPEARGEPERAINFREFLG